MHRLPYGRGSVEPLPGLASRDRKKSVQITVYYDNMRRTDRLQGTLELLILKSLEYQPNHGFGVTLHVQNVSDGLLHVEEGSLYPALHRLEKEKLIKGEWRVTDHGRRARIYSLTAAGRKRLADAESNWTSVVKGVQKLLRFA